MTANAGLATGSETPLHLWIVGGLSLLWNGFGCADFVLTNLRWPAYVAQLPPDMIDYIDGFPAWVIAVWALGVGSGLMGSILLLARSYWAAYAFAFSLLGLAASQFYQFVVGQPASMTASGNWIMTVVIWLIAVGLLLYALRMRTRLRRTRRR